MAVTEYTTESWGSRLMGSIKSVLGGLALFVLAFPLLFWNEGNAVRTAKALEVGQANVQTVPADKVDSGKEGKLVHMTGTATTDETLADEEFKVSAKAIKLEREVEMYQWEETKKSETKKNTGGSTTTKTTYDYKKTWSSRLIDSSDFKEAGHDNPPAMRYQSESWMASNVTLGAFTLTPTLIGMISGSKDIAVDAKAVENLPMKPKAEGGGMYLGSNPSAPVIGDIKVSFSMVPPGVVSLVGQQSGSTFVAYQPTTDLPPVLLLKTGTMTANQMFEAAQAENAMMCWILRFVFWLFMFVGLLMIFKPISVFADVIPMVGSMLGAGLGLFAFLISAALSILTIAVAWLFYRPLLGVVLLIVAGGAMTGLVMLGMKAKKARAASKAAAPAGA